MSNLIHSPRGRTGELTLSTRLAFLAGWVPQGARLADIGTDHAYLPVWLDTHGRVSAAIAADLRPGPLQRARETGKLYGARHVDYRLCDGLAAISAEECDTIVIAGMGGENIAGMEVTAGEMSLSPGQIYCGAKLVHDPLGERYIIERIIQLQGVVAGKNKSADPKDRAHADQQRALITELLAMREEWRHANSTGN